MRNCVLLRKVSLTLAVICVTLFSATVSVAANARSMPELTSLVERASPAVVNITATRTRPSIGDMNGQEVPELFKRFFDNLLFFLSLISVFTLLLAGIGMQSSLAALLRRKEKSFAILPRATVVFLGFGFPRISSTDTPRALEMGIINP